MTTRTPVTVPYMRPGLADPALIARDIESILRSRVLTKGKVVRAYEEALEDRLRVRNVIATANCTIGLALLYKALGLSGIVIVPSYTFMATVHAVVWAGARPVFADVDPETWTLDPQSVLRAITPDLAAIVAVPIFGASGDNQTLEHIASEANVDLLFDSAHGIGSTYRGVPLGGNGKAEVFSTSPTKVLVTGEGGLVSTNDDALASEIRALVEYGNDGQFDSIAPGLNGRLSDIHAAIGLRNLEILDELLERRWALVDQYKRMLQNEPGIVLQRITLGDTSSYKDFTILITDDFGLSADELASLLSRSFGIETKRYFSPAVHRQRPYREIKGQPLPVTEKLERQAISLPLWPGLSPENVEYVCESLLKLRG